VIAINRSWELAPWSDWLWAADSGRFWLWETGSIRLRQDVDAMDFEATKITLASDESPAPAKANLPVLAEQGVRILWHPGSEWHTGLSRDPTMVRGNNGGYQSINAAALAGGNPIITLGLQARGKHWHKGWPIGQPSYEAEGALDPSGMVRKHRAAIEWGGRELELGWFGAPEDARRCEAHYRNRMASTDDPPSSHLQSYYIPNFATMLPDLEDMGTRVIQSTPNSAIKVFENLPLEEALP